MIETFEQEIKSETEYHLDTQANRQDVRKDRLTCYNILARGLKAHVLGDLGSEVSTPRPHQMINVARTKNRSGEEI